MIKLRVLRKIARLIAKGQIKMKFKVFQNPSQ